MLGDTCVPLADFLIANASLVGEQVPVDQKYARFISEDTAFLKDAPSQVLRNGAYRWRTAYQRFFKGLGGRPTIRKKHGRQSVMLTSDLFTIKDGVIWVGTKTRPLGRLDVSDLDFGDMPHPKTIYISVEVGRWHVSFSSDDGAPEYTETEVADWLREMPDLADKADGTDLGVEVPVATSRGKLLGFSDAQKTHLAKAEKRKRRHQRIAARR